MSPDWRIVPAWRGPILRVALAALALIILFHADWIAMAGQWWNSSTYNHALFIPPIIAWLVTLRAPQLSRIEPRAWWPGLILFAGVLFLWLLGAVSDLNLARQLGAVGMLQATALTLLGPRVAAALLFPLGYALFLVPFGDELVPALQLLTADITIALTHLSGIPAQIDGVFIDTPVGLFEVAEACSGVKFLVAMMALGVLVANVCFVSWRRRAVFLAACAVVPILANGIRAWGTIQIAQSRGIAFAAGFDHVVYGWVFFAVVMALILAVAWRFFDRPADAPFVDPAAIAASRLLGRLPEGRMAGWPALTALLTVAGVAILWAGAANRLSADLPNEIRLPDVPGWQLVDYQPRVWWEPKAEGAGHRLLGRYRDSRGRMVDVFYALYPSQGEGREAGGYGQGALTPGSAWRWLRPGQAMPPGHSEHLLANGHVGRLAVTYYRTGKVLTGSNARLKLAVMRGRLLLLDENPTALLILSAEDRGGVAPESDIAAFRHAIGPVDVWMDRVAKLR